MGEPGVGWLADRDYSALLVGVQCQRVPKALQEDNSVSLARAFNVARRLIRDL